MPSERIIAVGLLSQSDLERLGDQFTRVWPVNDTLCFNSLLQAIDEADRQFWRAQDEPPEVAQDAPQMILIRQDVPR